MRMNRGRAGTRSAAACEGVGPPQTTAAAVTATQDDPPRPLHVYTITQTSVTSHLNSTPSQQQRACRSTLQTADGYQAQRSNAALIWPVGSWTTPCYYFHSRCKLLFMGSPGPARAGASKERRHINHKILDPSLATIACNAPRSTSNRPYMRDTLQHTCRLQGRQAAAGTCHSSQAACQALHMTRYVRLRSY